MTGLAVVVLLAGSVFFVKGNKGKTETGGARSPAAALYNQALDFKKSNEIVKAQAAYQHIMTQYPDYEGMEAVEKALEEVNIRIIASNVRSPKAIIHKVEPGDSLVKIAKKYDTTIELIKKRNNLNSDTIRAGQQISVYSGNFKIFVDKSQDILILKDGDEVVKTYNASTGVNNSTPVGTFKIITKLVDPVWFKSGAIIPPESPQNVLGSRWMGFDLPGYGIHGTIEPENIGKQVTAGCVRMLDVEVEELYDIVPMGTPVVIVD